MALRYHFTRQQVLTGCRVAATERLTLRAGPLTCTYGDGDLRNIGVDRFTCLRRIYVAVRDEHWGTPPAVLSDVVVTRRARSFDITFTAEHRQGAVAYRWQGSIVGGEEGVITFRMEGVALATFRSNRIGFCVLHSDACAGLPCTVEHTDGSVEEGEFPQWISPHQPFLAIRAIEQEAAAGSRLRVEMDGDTFEMEDQRNWSDASFKTYSTPLALPYPVTTAAGTRHAQRVTVRLMGDCPDGSPRETAADVHLSDAAFGRLPRLGLGLPDDAAAPGEREVARLRALALSHLRLGLDLSTEAWQGRLASAAALAERLGCGLEAALTVPAPAAAAADALRAVARAVAEAGAPIARWLLYTQGASVTAQGLARLARDVLATAAPGAALFIGTDANFSELNRGRPPLEGADGVCWSMNPQVHACDDLSIMETVLGQRAIVRSARRLYPGALLAASPVTLRPRVSRAAESATAPEALPRTVDPRQMALFAAAWTLGSIAALAYARADSATYYETVGWRGLLLGDEGSPLPVLFPAEPGTVFPVYWLLARLAAWREAEVVLAAPEDRRRTAAVGLRQGERRALALANLTASPQPVYIHRLAGPQRLWRLNESNAEPAMRHPEAALAAGPDLVHAAEDELALLLWPYEVAWLEGAYSAGAGAVRG